MKHMMTRYGFSGSDRTHRAVSFPFFGRSIMCNYHLDHNRYSGISSGDKKANSEFIPVGFFIHGES